MPTPATSFRALLRLLPPEKAWPLWRRLFFGVLCGVVSVLVRLPFEPVLAGSLPFVFFQPAVTVSAVRGGVSASVATVVVCLLYLILGSPFLHRFSFISGLPFLLFLIASVLTTIVAVELRSALKSLRDREGELRSTTDTLERSETLRRAILESATDYAIISLDAQGSVTSWNEGAFRTMGWTEAEMLGKPAHVIFTAEEIAQGVPEQEMHQALEHGRGEDERFHLRKDGSRFWANGLMMPLRTKQDAALGFIKILRDRTQQHAAEQALKASETRLKLERSTLEAIFQVAPVGLSLAEAPGGASILVNEEVRRLTGRDITGNDLSRYGRAGALHPDGRPYAVEEYPSVRTLIWGEVIKGEPVLFERPDGERIRAELSSTPLLNADGSIAAGVTVLVDVEAREQAVERQRLLLDELAHRMKNTLAMVQAIVSQTLRAAPSTEAARAEIMERLGVLSRAQDVLTRTSWVSASLVDIVGAALAPQALEPARLRMEGPSVQIGARAALSFTLALHELATNSIKYGALSVVDGRVEVVWSVQEREGAPALMLTWNETGGPPVSPPTRKGFGSRLIETVSRTFSGESTLSYDRAGVCWKVTAGLDALQAF